MPRAAHREARLLRKVAIVNSATGARLPEGYSNWQRAQPVKTALLIQRRATDRSGRNRVRLRVAERLLRSLSTASIYRVARRQVLWRALLRAWHRGHASEASHRPSERSFLHSRLLPVSDHRGPDPFSLKLHLNVVGLVGLGGNGDYIAPAADRTTGIHDRAFYAVVGDTSRALDSGQVVGPRGLAAKIAN